MPMNYPLSSGDIVKLKDPYRPEEWAHRKPKTWRGFEYGIMVEIVSTQFTVNGDLYGNTQIPRNVSLHLYDASGHLFILPQWIEKRLMIPEYVDHHISELILYKIATETGYVPVADPPNWDSVWDEEMSILKEFEYQISIEKLDSQVLNTSGLGHKRRHRIAPVFFYKASRENPGLSSRG